MYLLLSLMSELYVVNKSKWRHAEVEKASTYLHSEEPAEDLMVRFGSLLWTLGPPLYFQI